MDDLVFALVMVPPVAVCLVTVSSLAGVVLALGLLLALIAGVLERVPVNRFGTGQKKPAPRSAAAVAAVAIFTAEVTVGAHPRSSLASSSSPWRPFWAAWLWPAS